MNHIPLIHELLKIGITIFVVVFIVLKWTDIKEIFSEDSGRMSSKRVIALMGMVTLCRLAIYTTKSTDDIDNNVLAVLTIVILTASAIATLPQILKMITKLKEIGSKLFSGETTKIDKNSIQTTKTEEQK